MSTWTIYVDPRRPEELELLRQVLDAFEDCGGDRSQVRIWIRVPHLPPERRKAPVH